MSKRNSRTPTTTPAPASSAHATLSTRTCPGRAGLKGVPRDDPAVRMQRQPRLATDAVLENKQTVRAFYDLAFTQRRPNDAATRYFLPTPSLSDALADPTSPQAHAAAISAWLQSLPRLELEVVRLVAEGDLVVVHSRFVPAPGERPLLVMDLFRLRAGRIVEHWDALQEVRLGGPPAQ